MAAGPAGAVVELLPSASRAEEAEAPRPGAARASRWTAGGTRRPRHRRLPQTGRHDRAVRAHPLHEVPGLAATEAAEATATPLPDQRPDLGRQRVRVHRAGRE